jgi:chemotaxis protein methyltransferase CheR
MISIKVPQMECLSISLREALIQLIASHTGLAVKEYDRESLSKKVCLRMKALKISIPELYYQLLTSQTTDSVQEWQNLIPLITNPESFFFRDKGQFSLLRHQILPELIQRKQADKTLRICSAGCSTGEEPYSLAILIQELIPDLEQWNLSILGVDISAEALEKARRGIYRSWSLRNLDEEITQRYFRSVNDHYYLDEQIKQRVKFQTLNLVSEPLPQVHSDLEKIDLIVCRNVFIYFEAAAIAKTVEKFYNTLQPSGYLLVGHSELHGQDLRQFETKVFQESVAYQRPADQQVELPVSSTQLSHFPAEKKGSGTNDLDLETAFGTNNTKMQQVAVNLLKQLPAHTKIPKLNNLTAAELLLKLEIISCNNSNNS